MSRASLKNHKLIAWPTLTCIRFKATAALKYLIWIKFSYQSKPPFLPQPLKFQSTRMTPKKCMSTCQCTYVPQHHPQQFQIKYPSVTWRKECSFQCPYSSSILCWSNYKWISISSTSYRPFVPWIIMATYLPWSKVLISLCHHPRLLW